MPLASGSMRSSQTAQMYSTWQTLARPPTESRGSAHNGTAKGDSELNPAAAAVRPCHAARGAWHQRIAATLFHQGVPVIGSMTTPEGRAAAGQVELSPAGRQAVQAGLRQIDRLTAEPDPVRRQLGMLSRRQPGCAALRATQFGIGPVTAVAIWAELGDVRRFASSGNVVRHTGLDITVWSSDGKGAPRAPVPAGTAAAALFVCTGPVQWYPCCN